MASAVKQIVKAASSHEAIKGFALGHAALPPAILSSAAVQLLQPTIQQALE